MLTLLIILATVITFVHAGKPWSSKSAGCVKANQYTGQAKGTEQEYTITYDSVVRYYRVYIPTNYKTDRDSGNPVIFALPGYLTSAQDFAAEMKINQDADEQNFIIVYPQGNNLPRGNGEPIYNWNDLTSSKSPGPEGPICDTKNVNRNIKVAVNECPDTDGGECAWTNCKVDDIGFIEHLVTVIDTAFCVNVLKRYIMGFSNGGMMTHTLACKNENGLFAAAVTLHGQRHLGYNCVPAKKMPIMLVHGTNDQILPGRDIVSRSQTGDGGWYFLPVTAVQDAFANRNQCDKSAGQQPVTTDSDGKADWTCTGYVTGCDQFPVIQCETRWKHTYLVNVETGRNMGMPAIWQFLKNKSN